MSRVFDERERAAETAFVHGEELRFLARRRAVHALGAWAAECIGLDPEATQAYQGALVDDFIAAMPDERLVAKVQTDLERAGKPSLTTQVATVLARAEAQAVDEMRGHTIGASKEDPLDSWDRRHPARTSWGSLRF